MRLRRFLSKGGWNLIGADTNFSLANVTFTNSSGTSYTWANALSNNKVQAYLSYYDSSSAVASQRKFKYLSTISGMDDTSLRKNKGYWIYMNESGNLTLPSAGGSWANESYAYSKLRYSNGTSEVNISQAGLGGYGWIEDTLQYWNTTNSRFQFISSLNFGLYKNTLYPWEGVFVLSKYDNITLIRQN